MPEYFAELGRSAVLALSLFSFLKFKVTPNKSMNAECFNFSLSPNSLISPIADSLEKLATPLILGLFLVARADIVDVESVTVQYYLEAS